MSDDVPISEPHESIWQEVPEGYIALRLRFATSEVIARLKIEKIYATAEALISEVPSKLLALAAHAAEQDQPVWVVGTLIFLAARREDAAAIWILLERLARPEASVDARVRRRRAAAYWYRRLKDRDPLRQSAEIAKSLSSVAEAIQVDRALRAGARLERHRVIVRDHEAGTPINSELAPYRNVFQPLPVWQPSIKPSQLAELLTMEFPHLSHAASVVAQVIAADDRDRQTPVVIVGPSGVGKDALWRRAIEISGRPSVAFDIAGSADNRALKGTAKGWSSRAPSLPVVTIARLGVANPAIHLSELEKAGGSRVNGLVFDTFLGWLEPASAQRFFDEGLGCAVDLSSVAFCFTANSMTTIPPALRTRLRIVEAQRIGREHVDVLVDGSVRRRAMELGLDAATLPPLAPQVRAKIQRLAGKGSLNLRSLERLMRVIVSEDWAKTQATKH